MTIESAWFAENCPPPVLLPAAVSALDIARWYAHDLANFLLAPSYCDALRTYLPVWRLPVPERWCFVPHTIEEAAMQCYRSAIREALERGRGSTGGHEIAQVLEEWAAAPAFRHPELDGMRADLLLDRTLELRPTTLPGGNTGRVSASALVSGMLETHGNLRPREQYRVIGGRPYHRRVPPESGQACWAKEPEWTPYPWNGDGQGIVGAFLRHEGAQPNDRPGDQQPTG